MASRMTEKGYQWGIKALQKRRAEIAGEIALAKIALRRRQSDLAKVDDILRILAPESDPTTLPAKRALKGLNIFRQGELSALVKGVLRAAGRPMSNLEITAAIIQEGRFSAQAWTPMRKRIRANLAYQHEEGRIIKTGFADTARWALPPRSANHQA